MRIYSRIKLAIDYGTLADLISLPEGMRIVVVRPDDEKGEVGLTVEGIEDGFKYKWRPGMAVVCQRINYRKEIQENLYVEKSLKNESDTGL